MSIMSSWVQRVPQLRSRKLRRLAWPRATRGPMWASSWRQGANAEKSLAFASWYRSLATCRAYAVKGGDLEGLRNVSGSPQMHGREAYQALATSAVDTNHRMVTTPIFYVNGSPHIGHAFTGILADVCARWMRLSGKPGGSTRLLTGTDEHGEKVMKSALEKAGMADAKGGGDDGGGSKCAFSPLSVTQQHVDAMKAEFMDMCTMFDVSASIFMRTTDPAHGRTVQDVWRRLDQRGLIRRGVYSGWYCTREERFLARAELGVRDADSGDEITDCNDTRERAIAEGITDPLSEDGRQVEVYDVNMPTIKGRIHYVSEETHLFSVRPFLEELKSRIASGSFTILPKMRATEVLALIDLLEQDEAATAISISRPATRCAWGVPAPRAMCDHVNTEDVGTGETKDATVYVWFDALLNYMSGAEMKGVLANDCAVTGVSSPNAQSSLVNDKTQLEAILESYRNLSEALDCPATEPATYWPPDLQVMGKDILKFHAVLLPCLCLALDLALPRRLLIHGHWVVGGTKMSKSLGNVINPKALAGAYGAEAVRYYLMCDAQLSGDANFCEERLRDTYVRNLVGATSGACRKWVTGPVS